MIKKNLCIKDFQDRSLTGSDWGSIYGYTDNGEKIHYTGGTSNAYITKIPILLTQTINDMGFFDIYYQEWIPGTKYLSGDFIIHENESYKSIVGSTSITFNNNEWVKTSTTGNTNTIIYAGESKIDEFRRYSKTDSDSDLYNPPWNTGYTYYTYTNDGNIKQITGEQKNNYSNISLYRYKIGNLNYEDTSENNSTITYQASGLTTENSVNLPMIKNEYLMGVTDKPKIEIDVFIDRGQNSAFERHLKLNEIKSFVGLKKYGNGYYKIKDS